jgi:hypothetical protein
MRTGIIVILLLLGGCSTQSRVSSASGSVEALPTKPVTAESRFQYFIRTHRNIGEPLAEIADDSHCLQTYGHARRALRAALPIGLTKAEEVERLSVENRLIGISYADTGQCQVYDISEIALRHFWHTPYEQFDNELSVSESVWGFYSKSNRNAAGERYYEVAPCPLCLTIR